jgi:hypothetical protein
MRVAVITAAGLATVALLTGCGESTPFAQRTEHTCATASATITGLSAPVNPSTGLKFALDRFSAMDLAVSTVTDSSLPSGSAGAQLRERWLVPARASLATGRTALAALQRAVHQGDDQAAATEFTIAAAAGTAAVDPSVLTATGLPECAALFSPSNTRPGW